jgi:hypothetical protein
LEYSKVIFTRYTHNGHLGTPKTVFEQLNNEFHFTFDPCPYSKKPKLDGLRIKWHGKVWVNPPYSDPAPWLEKALSELDNFNCSLVVFLIKSATGTKWFHDLVIPNALEIRAIKGRLSFIASGERAPFDSLIVVFKN